MTVILNFKTYAESAIDGALQCAIDAYNFSKKTKHKIIICPQNIDIEKILENVKQTENFKVWSQHIDYQRGGQQTGYLTIETIKELGLEGSLLNHAEHKINEIEKYIEISKEIELCYCCNEAIELSIVHDKYPEFTPKYAAFEPPSLIGGNISVSKSKPLEIENFVDRFKKYEVLVGAGIKTHDDVFLSQKYGAKGILISSGFVFSPNRESFLTNLL